MAQAVAIDGSGRIVAAGWAVNPVGYDEVFALARYKSDGSLDTTFDNDGQVTTNILPYPNWQGSRERLGAIAIDPLGRLVVAGRLGQDYGHIAHSSAFVVLRYKATGSLDTSFNGGAGIAAPLFNGNNRDDAASAVAIDDQGRIVVAGKAWSGASDHFALARLHHDGTPDHSFDGDGKVITSFGPCPSEAKAVMFDNSGKLLAAGLVTGTCVSGFAMARYNVDGSLDNTFTGGNYNGLATTDFSCSGSQTEEGARAIAIQYSHPYGGVPRIILAGFTTGDSCRP
ncbi:MAG: hypothetical protein M3X11_10325 [Acidobacteriota bacterium]|nr:hypothetical protein [Acidobacteriota bacterium]